MNPNEIIDRLNDILKTAPKVCNEYYDTKATYENLKELQKFMIAAIGKGFTGSEASREREALGSQEYKDYLKGLENARTEHYKALSLFKRMEIALAVCQSMNKIMTAQINISNFE